MDKKRFVIAGGCFWCMEAVFKNIPGVLAVESGYAGGHLDNPTYEQVTTGQTGHAEAIRVTYDSDRLDYRQLLTIFFMSHDPTTLNRQGNDVGTQYRSAVFYSDEQERMNAKDLIAELSKDGVYKDSIVTELVPAGAFYLAEDHHQDYYNKNSRAPYCQLVINPKLEKLKKSLPGILSEKNSHEQN